MEDSRIRKMMFNEVSLAMAIVGVTLSVSMWVINPQQDLKEEIIRLKAQIESNETVRAELAKIKNNDLHELQLSIGRLEERDIAILQAVARVEALLAEKKR